MPAAGRWQGSSAKLGEWGQLRRAEPCGNGPLAAGSSDLFGFNQMRVAVLFSRTALGLAMSSSRNLNSTCRLNEPHMKEVIGDQSQEEVLL